MVDNLTINLRPHMKQTDFHRGSPTGHHWLHYSHRHFYSFTVPWKTEGWVYVS